MCAQIRAQAPSVKPPLASVFTNLIDYILLLFYEQMIFMTVTMTNFPEPSKQNIFL